MPYRNAPLTLLTVFVALTSGCAGWPPDTKQIAQVDPCRIEHAMVYRDASQGAEFTNHCKQCLVVAFELETVTSGDQRRNACYVPAETRVFFATDGGYTITAEKICEDVETDESIASIPVEYLKANYISDKCKIIGVFAD